MAGLKQLAPEIIRRLVAYSVEIVRLQVVIVQEELRMGDVGPRLAQCWLELVRLEFLLLIGATHGEVCGL